MESVEDFLKKKKHRTSNLEWQLMKQQDLKLDFRYGFSYFLN